MASTTPATGSAERWGPLWGARPHDWAESEEQQEPTYLEAIRRVGIGPGRHVLEVGCGSGVFLRLAADRGAAVSGLDASEALVQLARARVPEADVRVGDMQFLPYEDDVFDVVAGFNAFFFAADLVAALREAGRVAKPGAPVVIQVWGPPERNDLEATKAVLRPYWPAPPPGTPAPPPLWQPGVLEELAAAADLDPQEAFDLRWAYEYPDEATLGRLLLSVGGIAVLAAAHLEEVRAQIVASLAPYRREDGSYRLESEFHFLVARA